MLGLFYSSIFVKNLDRHVLRNVSRFRLRAHHLRELRTWLGSSEICDKCGSPGGETCYFFCNCAGVCQLRTRYKDLFADIMMFKSLHVFARLQTLALFLSMRATASLTLRSTFSR